MSSAGRLIASCVAVVAAAVVMLGCASSDEVTVDLPPETITAINAKLDQIQDRFDAGACTGSNSAETSLESLQAAVDGLDGVDQQFRDDMNQLLGNLGKQIASQCRETDTTTSSSTTTDTIPTTTDTIPTATDTTTTTTKSTTTTTSTTPEPPTGPPGNPDNPNGNGPTGGVSPGGKKSAAGKPKIDKPEPKHGHGHGNDEKERSR